MKSIILLAVLLASLQATASAQEPARIAPGRPMPPVNAHPGARVEADLSRNYRLTTSLRLGDKPAKEIVVLTASAQIRISAVLEPDEATQASTSVEVSGILSEKEDGSLRFSYQVGASIPRVSQTMSSRNQADGPKSVVTSISYTNESASGVLVMEPGKSYEIFRSSARSYSLTVEPVMPGKGK